MNTPFSVIRDTFRRQVPTDLSKHKGQVHPVHDSDGAQPNKFPAEPLRRKFRKAQSFASFNFMPKSGYAMEDWTTIPDDHHESSGIFFNSVTLPFKWVVWTSKALSGLPPHQSLRERLCNQSASLGSVAGLYLVIAISGFFIPPVVVLSLLPQLALSLFANNNQPAAHNDFDKILVDIFGVLMFLSAMSLTVYICLALTVMYPLLESLPDFAAMEAYRSLAKRWGGYENFLFNIGCQAVLLAMIVAATVIYDSVVLFVMLGTFAVLYFIAAFMTREFFIAIDPITSVHMGLCNAPDTIHRAKALAQAIRDRHQEFVEDADNFPEYAAMHYLDPSVKKRAEMKGLAANRAWEDSLTDIPRRSEADRNELQPKAKYHVNPRYQYETVPAGSVGDGADDTYGNGEDAGRGAGGVEGEGVRKDKKKEPGEVTDFAETGVDSAGDGAKAARVPSLEDILIGQHGLLFMAQAPRVTVAACESMHRLLVAQGCASTDHLVELLRFCRRGSVGSVGRGGGAGESGNEKLGGADALTVMQSMGVGAFHTMALVKYIDSLVELHRL